MSLKGNIEAKQEARGKIKYLGYNEIQEKIAKADAAADAANKAAKAANDVAEKGAHYAERLVVAEKTLDEVFDDGFKSITKDSPEISRREESVYFDKNANLEINSNYTTYYINVSEDFDMFFDGLAPLLDQEDGSIHSEMLYLVVFGSSSLAPSNARVKEVFSTEEYSSGFPYSAEKKLQVHAGETITISVAKKDPNNEYSNATIYFDGTEYVEGFLLRYNQDGATHTLSPNVRIGSEAFGPTVKIVGGNKPTDVGRLEVDRDFETYAASNRKFAAYDYYCFFAKDKLANGKPLAVRTLVWTESQLDAYSNQNTATDLILEDYKANPDKYHYDAEDDCLYRDIFVHFPLKDGQVAIIEKGGVLRAYNFEGDNVKTGATNTAWVIFENDGGTEDSYNRMYNDFWKLKKVTSIEAPKADATFKKVTAGATNTAWVIFENDEATMGAPNRMFNDSWQLSKVFEIKAPSADTWLKNVHTQAVYAPWLVFDNDGGTEATYNRLYNVWWKLNKLQSIYAPHCVATFDNVLFRGENLITKFSQMQSKINELQSQIDELKTALNSQTGGE